MFRHLSASKAQKNRGPKKDPSRPKHSLYVGAAHTHTHMRIQISRPAPALFLRANDILYLQMKLNHLPFSMLERFVLHKPVSRITHLLRNSAFGTGGLSTGGLSRPSVLCPRWWAAQVPCEYLGLGGSWETRKNIQRSTCLVMVLRTPKGQF